MLSKRQMRRRSKEEKEQVLLEVQRLGVIAGCRKHNIDPSTYYKWLDKYNASGIEGLEDRRGRNNDLLLKRVEKENRLLKEILAEKDLELKMKDELLKKKMAQWKSAKK